MASPTLIAAPVIDVTLALFGGTDTEISPSDVPEGLSPDNQDMIFLPGDTASRYGLKALYNPPFPGGVAVVYETSYVQPNNDPMTLVLTSDGKLWAEDVGNSPGIKVQIGATTPGLYAQSVSAFGREYIAFSDLLHGQDIPLQFDGANLDRVTQDGPGAAPVVGDENVSGPIAASPNGLRGFINPIVASASETGFLVTMLLNFLVGGGGFIQCFKSGDQWQVAGVGAGYNGTFPIASCMPQGATQAIITYFTNVGGLAALGAGGSISLPYYEVVNVVAQLNPPLNLNVTIAGAGNGAYNGTWQVRFVASDVTTEFFVILPLVFGLTSSGNGTWANGGNVAVGTHQFVVMFLTRQGGITKPSPPGYWAAAGGKRAILGNLPIGPANVVARIVGFTGAGGGNFFIIPASITQPNPGGGTPVQIQATIIPDNTSTSATIDFSDNTLFAGIAIDQIGNDLFDQRVLGPVLGFFAYASRLAAWGDFNKVENLLNMGFDGAFLAGTPLAPLGWTIGCVLGTGNANGELVTVGTPPGLLWTIWGGGTNPQGLISQSAYQDADGVAVLLPNTLYDVRVKLAASSLLGGLLFTLSSASTGFSTSGVFQLANLTGTMKFYQARLGTTPAAIPPDLILQIYGQNIPGGQFVLVDEAEVVYEQNPYNNSLARISYALNPEGFAQTTGNLGPTDDQSPIQNFSLQKDTGLLHTSEATHDFTDNNFEPGDGNNAWPVKSLTHSVGALSLRACDPGKFGTGDAAEDWDIIASDNGVYIHLGSAFYKVSQEMARTVGTAPNAVTWDDVNRAAKHTVWVKNFVKQRYALIGAPVNGATAPNLIFALDYREMDTAAQIAAALPIHITLSGKMKSSDMTRKWTRWNIKANCAEVLLRPDGVKELFLGGGSGATPGTGVAYGNLYSLDPAKLSDDDYGQIAPYYITYAFVDHDQELQLQLGSGRHLYKRISAFITGVGLVTITPLVNSLVNALPASMPRQLLTDASAATAQTTDLEWTTGVHGHRVFFRIDVTPLPGTTDVQIKLQKLIVGMMKDPVALFRGSRV